MSVHKSLLLSALTIKMDKSLAGSTNDAATSGWDVISGDRQQRLHQMMKMTG